MSLQVIPDPFGASAESVLDGVKGETKGGTPFIRRPTRGIVLKEETFATLRVVAGDGTNHHLVDAGSRRGPGEGEFYEIGNKRATDIYSNFFLQSINEERQEKQQILETFGEPYIFLFGERARIITFSGVLLNTFDFNWEAEWWHNYENYLRGTRCVENDARVFISFDETLVSGYIIGTASSKNSNEPHHVNFQFQLFVTSYANFSKIGDPHALPGVTFTEDKYMRNTESEAENYRPNLITQDGIASKNETLRALGDYTATNNLAPIPSLVEGLLRTGIGTVVKTFNKAQQIANSALKSLSNLVAGEVIRIPIGFEGSMAFDVGKFDPEAKELVVSQGGVITYSTFDKNDDEYVGSGTHYGSSLPQKGKLFDPYADQIKEQENSVRYTLARAQAVWADAGLEIPGNQLGPISAFLAGKGIGLLAVGATSGWRNQKPDTTSVVRIRGG
jgi:hypothetical protein